MEKHNVNQNEELMNSNKLSSQLKALKKDAQKAPALGTPLSGRKRMWIERS